MTKADRKRIQELTMPCWWPKGKYPLGQVPGPDWNSIKLELLGRAETARLGGFTETAEEAQRLADLIPK